MNFQHNAEKLAKSIKQYYVPKLNRLNRIERGRAASLPEAYKKYWAEYNSESTPVHFRKEDRIWRRDEETGEIRRTDQWPIEGIMPPEAHQGLWGNETIIKGYQKRQALKKRVPHYWVPTLYESVVYSEILNKYMSTVVTKRARLLITEHFGLDHYLLKTPACDLQSKLALGLKRKMLLALRDKTLYPEDPEKQAEVYNKYKHYLDAYTHEELEWYGLSLGDALSKWEKMHKEANAPKPLKSLYRQELIAALQNPTPEYGDEDAGSSKPSAWIKKLNPFASKEAFSSVLNKDVKQFGKQFMFDDNEETCWNSDQGLPQWIQLDFEKEETIAGVQIQFQGGFVGGDCIFECSSGHAVSLREPFYPEDVNIVQTFNLSKPTSSNSLKIVFNKSTDFFGRIVIYKLVVFNK